MGLHMRKSRRSDYSLVWAGACLPSSLGAKLMLASSLSLLGAEKTVKFLNYTP